GRPSDVDGGSAWMDSAVMAAPGAGAARRTVVGRGIVSWPLDTMNISQWRRTMSMADRDGYSWYDGKLVPWREATTHGLTHSLHYGLSVFEGVRAYDTVQGTAIFRLQDHTRRLFNSAHIYQMPIP